MNNTVQTFQRPHSLNQLLEAISHPHTRIIAGGTDLTPHLQAGLVRERNLVSLNGVSELAQIAFLDDHISIGAGVRLQQIIEHAKLKELYPVLSHGLSQIGAPQHRQRGAIGGNLCLDTRCYWYNQSDFWRESLGFCLKHDGDRCHVAPKGRGCYAVTSSDGSTLFSALDTRIRLQKLSGTRELPLIDFYQNNGLDHLGLQQGEVLTHILLPYPATGMKAVYHKLAIRKSFDFPILGVAASGVVENGVFTKLQLVLGAVESNPILVDGQASGWIGRKPGPQLFSQIQDHCFKLAKPMQNTFGVLGWRRKMVRTLVGRALGELIEGELE